MNARTGKSARQAGEPAIRAAYPGVDVPRSISCAGVSFAVTLCLCVAATVGLTGCDAAPTSRSVVEIDAHTVVAGQPVTQTFPFLPDHKVRLRGAPGQVTRAALDICTAVGIPNSQANECSAINILVASASQTNREFWFERSVGGNGKQMPERCLDPMLAEYRGPTEAPTTTTYLCHVAVKPDEITQSDMAQLRSAVAKLNAVKIKTYAAYQIAREIKTSIPTWAKSMEIYPISK